MSKHDRLTIMINFLIFTFKLPDTSIKRSKFLLPHIQSAHYDYLILKFSTQSLKRDVLK
jgi:hypothetical protein